MKKKTIAIIQCILYLIAPYIALQLCSINRSLVGEFFIIFFIDSINYIILQHSIDNYCLYIKFYQNFINLYPFQN